MNTALQESSRQALSLFDLPGCHFTDVGLTIEPGMRFEHWERLIRALERAEQGIQWYIGDALNYGEMEYGERYAQVLDAHKSTGIPIERLRQYQWVAASVAVVTRVTTLDWSVHREVAALPPDKQQQVLQLGAAAKAAGKKYTQRQAEKDANRIKREGQPKPKDSEVILSKETRAYLDDYMADLALQTDKIPVGISASEREALEKMIYEQGSDCMWLKNRTRTADYAAIAELFNFDEGSPGMERAGRADISSWLERCGYYMSDSDLDDRLYVMVENRMLEVHSVEESRQDGRRGVMLNLYALSAHYQDVLEH